MGSLMIHQSFAPPKFPGHVPHLGFGQGQSFMKPPSRAVEALHWTPKDGSFSLGISPLDPQLARGAPHQGCCRAVHFSQEDWGGPQNEHGKNLGLQILWMVDNLDDLDGVPQKFRSTYLCFMTLYLSIKSAHAS